MTEPQAEYVTDALEMMGVIEPRQIVTEISGFIPVFEVLLKKYDDHMTAFVFGRIWQYCGMSDGVCRATIERIAGDLKISGATVMRHIEKLEADGYIYDRTPDRRNRPHEYVDCGLIAMKGSLSAIAQKNVRPAQKNVAIAESQLIKQDNTNIKQKPPSAILSEQDFKEAGEKAQKIIELSQGPAWQGRDELQAQSLPLADWYNSTTGQVMTKRVKKSWWKALSDWRDEGLEIEHLQAAYEAQKAWRMVSDPNMLTKDAVAIKAAGKAKPKVQHKVYRPEEHEEPKYVPAPPRKR